MKAILCGVVLIRVSGCAATKILGHSLGGGGEVLSFDLGRCGLVDALMCFFCWVGHEIETPGRGVSPHG